MRAVTTLLALMVGLAACGGADDGPTAVTLAELVAEQDRFHGELVRVEGTVATYHDPPHSWIEDVEQHRVELFPHEEIEALAGHRVRVEGRFTFDPERGRGIDVRELEVLDRPPAAAPDPPRWDGRAQPDAGPRAIDHGGPLARR